MCRGKLKTSTSDFKVRCATQKGFKGTSDFKVRRACKGERQLVDMSGFKTWLVNLLPSAYRILKSDMRRSRSRISNFKIWCAERLFFSYTPDFNVRYAALERGLLEGNQVLKSDCPLKQGRQSDFKIRLPSVGETREEKKKMKGKTNKMKTWKRNPKRQQKPTSSTMLIEKSYGEQNPRRACEENEGVCAWDKQNEN